MQLTKRPVTPFKVEPQSKTEIMRNMTQTISFMVGALLMSIGVVEIFVPRFVDMNLSIFHSVLIGSAGASLVYNGFKARTYASYLTCLIYGSIFAVLSAIGFIFGERTNAFVRYDQADDFLLNIPGFNPLGTFDHGVHAVLAIVLLLGALDWKRHHTNF